jgi:hypothetical protein
MTRAGVAARTMGGVVVLFLLFDSVGKLIPLAPMVEGTIELGYPATVVRVLGAIELPVLRCTSSPAPGCWARYS